jgi:hypothetical protein
MFCVLILLQLQNVELRRLRAELRLSKLEGITGASNTQTQSTHSQEPPIQAHTVHPRATLEHEMDEHEHESLSVSARGSTLRAPPSARTHRHMGQLQLQYHRAGTYDVSACVVDDQDNASVGSDAEPISSSHANTHANTRANTHSNTHNESPDRSVSSVRQNLTSRLSKDLFGDEDVLVTPVDTHRHSTHSHTHSSGRDVSNNGDNDVSSLLGVVDGDRPGYFSGIRKGDMFVSSSSSSPQIQPQTQTHSQTHTQSHSKSHNKSPLMIQTPVDSGHHHHHPDVHMNTGQRKENRVAVAALVHRLESVADNLEKQQHQQLHTDKHPQQQQQQQAVTRATNANDTEIKKLLRMLEDQKSELNKLYQVQQQQLELAASLTPKIPNVLTTTQANTQANTHANTHANAQTTAVPWVEMRWTKDTHITPRTDVTTDSSARKQQPRLRSLSPHTSVSSPSSRANSNPNNPNVAFFRTAERSRSLSPHTHNRRMHKDKHDDRNNNDDADADHGNPNIGDNSKSEQLPFYRLDQRYRSRGDGKYHNIYDVGRSPRSAGSPTNRQQQQHHQHQTHQDHTRSSDEQLLDGQTTNERTVGDSNDSNDVAAGTGAGAAGGSNGKHSTPGRKQLHINTEPMLLDIPSLLQLPTSTPMNSRTHASNPQGGNNNDGPSNVDGSNTNNLNNTSGNSNNANWDQFASSSMRLPTHMQELVKSIINSANTQGPQQAAYTQPTSGGTNVSPTFMAAMYQLNNNFGHQFLFAHTHQHGHIGHHHHTPETGANRSHLKTGGVDAHTLIAVQNRLLRYKTCICVDEYLTR